MKTAAHLANVANSLKELVDITVAIKVVLLADTTRRQLILILIKVGSSIMQFCRDPTGQLFRF